VIARLACIAAALVAAPAARAACVVGGGAYAATATSSGGRYAAAIASAHLALNEATSLALRITRTDGAPLAPGATVRLRVLMVMHGHGMTTRPVLRRLDDGSFVADGILLHMPGEWTLFLDVAEGPVTEKIETCVVV
jgi:hypothetical protein